MSRQGSSYTAKSHPELVSGLRRQKEDPKTKFRMDFYILESNHVPLMLFGLARFLVSTTDMIQTKL